MKNRKNTVQNIWSCLGAFMFLSMVACEPMEEAKPEIGEPPVPSFEVTVDPENDNRFIITNTTEDEAFLYTWEFGDGSTASSRSSSEAANAYYPFPGEYEIKLTAYGKGGSASASETITITETDTEICLNEEYAFLTGGCGEEGKTWVFAPSGPVNFGGPAATPNAWWNQDLASQDPCFKDDEYVFHLQNYEFVNNSGGTMWGINSEGVENVCVEQPAEPVASTWNLYQRTTDGQLMLSVSNGETIAWDDNAGTYEVVELTENRLHIRKTCCGGGADNPYRNYVLVPKGTDSGPVEPEQPEQPQEPEEPTRPLEENNIAVDFEGNSTIEEDQWLLDQVADYEFPVANPAQDEVNSSDNVFRYDRGTGQYENIQIHLDHKIDLTNRNVFKVKVYFPSENDYSGDLAQSFAVKLQNREMGADAWQTQEERKPEVNVLDEWVELTFDFSDVTDRKDFDSIVIQPGGEGHAAPGVFYFDDFELLPAE